MYTIYVDKIEDGTITTGKDFLKFCAEELFYSSKYNLDTYYKKEIDEIKFNIEKYETMSIEDAKTELIKFYKDKVEIYKSMYENDIKNNEKFTKIKTEVEAWNPPTERHRYLKQFALEKIDDYFIRYKQNDVRLKIYESSLNDSNKNRFVKKIINEKIKHYKKILKSKEKDLEKELKQIEDRNVLKEIFLRSL